MDTGMLLYRQNYNIPTQHLKLNIPPFLFLSALSRMRIDLTSMLGVYVVLGVGIVLAFLTLFAEIFWKRKAEQKWKNKTRRFET